MASTHVHWDRSIAPMQLSGSKPYAGNSPRMSCWTLWCLRCTACSFWSSWKIARPANAHTQCMLTAVVSSMVDGRIFSKKKKDATVNHCIHAGSDDYENSMHDPTWSHHLSQFRHINMGMYDELMIHHVCPCPYLPTLSLQQLDTSQQLHRHYDMSVYTIIRTTYGLCDAHASSLLMSDESHLWSALLCKPFDTAFLLIMAAVLLVHIPVLLLHHFLQAPKDWFVQP